MDDNLGEWWQIYQQTLPRFDVDGNPLPTVDDPNLRDHFEAELASAESVTPMTMEELIAFLELYPEDEEVEEAAAEVDINVGAAVVAGEQERNAIGNGNANDPRIGQSTFYPPLYQQPEAYPTVEEGMMQNGNNPDSSGYPGGNLLFFDLVEEIMQNGNHSNYSGDQIGSVLFYDPARGGITLNEWQAPNYAQHNNATTVIPNITVALNSGATIDPYSSFNSNPTYQIIAPDFNWSSAELGFGSRLANQGFSYASSFGPNGGLAFGPNSPRINLSSWISALSEAQRGRTSTNAFTLSNRRGGYNLAADASAAHRLFEQAPPNNRSIFDIWFPEMRSQNQAHDHESSSTDHGQYGHPRFP